MPDRCPVQPLAQASPHSLVPLAQAEPWQSLLAVEPELEVSEPEAVRLFSSPGVSRQAFAVRAQASSLPASEALSWAVPWALTWAGPSLARAVGPWVAG